jgi:serine/threonine protein kinase
MTNPGHQSAVSVEALVGQIADEYTQRVNRGERPSIEEYAEKHPEIASILREVLQALGMLRQPAVEAALAGSEPYLAAPLGDFRLIRKIGGGGMGIVYEAEQISLKRRVAVKILPIAAAHDDRYIQRFQKEAEAAANLHHEHVVPVHSVGFHRGIHYYAMQFIEGQSLADIIHEMRGRVGLEPSDQQETVPYADAAPSAFPETASLAALTTEGSMRSPAFYRAVARLGQEAAEGLEHAHQLGVLHRDIKPGNLLVDRRCSLWITDFGLAHMRSDARLTLTGELVGTIRYMSPEQALAKRVPVDHRTDIYSLGATLYELLTLEPVFKGRDRQELLRQIAFDDPKPVRRVNASIPRDLETIVSTAMAKAPDHRYASARDMAEDLQLFLNDQPIKTRPEGVLRWLGRKSRRHATSLVLLLTAIITSVVLAVILLTSKPPVPDSSPEQKEAQRQQDALELITRNLEAGKAVTLIGEKGSPTYFRWRSDQSQGKIAEAPDGTFSVQHWEFGLVELLQDPQFLCYRFSAEVRHEREPLQEGKVGIYFGHSELPDGATSAHFYCAVAFNDLFDQNAIFAKPGQKATNTVRLEAHRQPPRGFHHHAHVLGTDFEFAPALVTEGQGPWRRIAWRGIAVEVRPWRRIAVEVRPESIKIFWEGTCVATSSRANLMISARPLIANLDKPPTMNPQFAPRDGLGLFVSQGVASFRNVAIEPID